MIQFNLKYPNNDKIYFSKTPKDAAKNAFSDLKMNTNEISRIIVTNNNSKKDYEFIALTDKKVNQLTSIYDSRNPIQLGGSKNINDEQFYDKINEISGNINLSVSELTKILTKKYKPEKDEIIVLLQEGISKINNINDNLSLIAKSVTSNEKKKLNEDQSKIIISDVKTSETQKEIIQEINNQLVSSESLKESEIKQETNNQLGSSNLENISDESIDVSTIDIKNNIKNDISKTKLQSQKGCVIM